MVCVRGRMPGSGPGVRSRGGFLYELNLPPYPRWQKVKNCPTSGRQQVGAWRAPGDGRSGEGGAPGTLREIRGRNRPWPMPFYFGDVAGGGTIWGVRIFRPSRGFGRLPMRPGLQTELRLGAPEIWRTTGDPRAAGNWPVFRLFLARTSGRITPRFRKTSNWASSQADSVLLIPKNMDVPVVVAMSHEFSTI